MADNGQGRELQPPKSGCGWLMLLLILFVTFIALYAALDPCGFSALVRWFDSDWSDYKFRMPDIV
jgi:hypothetical protein